MSGPPAPPAEAPKPVPVAAPAPKPAPVAPVVSEVLLQFEFDKSDLTAEAKARLDDAVAALKANGQGGVSFALEGHADASGSERYNDKLSQARAETVRRHLAEQHQIAADKISVASFGESKPAASNETPEGRAQNRRVLIKVGA
jgi:OOP family OmpA-OmpF porin